MYFGFLSSRCDHSLFTYQHKDINLYTLVYVDDMLITWTSSKLVHDLISILHQQFSLKKLGKPKYFLDLEVYEQKKCVIILTQTKYIRDLLAKINMTGAYGVNTPMFIQCKLSRHGSDVVTDPHMYQSTFGALQYMTLTRMNIAFNVNKTYQFMANLLVLTGVMSNTF